MARAATARRGLVRLAPRAAQQRFTLVQIGIGTLDLSLVTLAMYTLLPPRPRSVS